MKRLTTAAYIVALTILVLACGSDSSASGNLGVAGATCQSSPQCEVPLQCIHNVCTAQDDFDTTTTDTVEPDWVEPVDTPIISDAVVSDATPADMNTPEDIPPEELPSQCEVLGIAPDWQGTFDGAIDFTITDPPPGILDGGTLVVTGELTFSIHCLGQKLVVVGTLDGMGSAEGQDGEHPFFADIAGSYSPSKSKLSAQLTDGVVKLTFFDAVSIGIWFEGTMTGTFNPTNTFSGTWEGAQTGNQLGWPSTATGSGAWFAAPTL